MTETEFRNLKPGDRLVNQFGEECTVQEPFNKRTKGVEIRIRSPRSDSIIHWITAKKPEYYQLAPTKSEPGESE